MLTLQKTRVRTVDLTPTAIEAIAESFDEWVEEGLGGKTDKRVFNARILLSRDPRISKASSSATTFVGLARRFFYI